jgi:transcriptional regulator with XRE-family HTH domain
MKPTLSQTTHATDIEIGAALRRYRKQAGLSQEAVASELGITFQQVQKYENGRNRVAVSTLIRICQFLGISPMNVIGSYFDGEPTEPAPSSRMAMRLAEAEQRVADVRAIVFPKARPVVAGMDMSSRQDMTTFHLPQ